MKNLAANKFNMKAKAFLILCLSCLATLICMTALSGCADSAVDFYSGKWQATEIRAGEIFIGNLEIVIDEDTANAENVIESNGKHYKVVLFIDGVQPDGLGITYYSKKMRLAFTSEQTDMTMTAVMRKKGSLTYIDASLTVESGSVKVTLQKA